MTVRTFPSALSSAAQSLHPSISHTSQLQGDVSLSLVPHQQPSHSHSLLHTTSNVCLLAALRPMALPPPSPLIHGFEGSSVSPMEDVSGEGFCLAFDDPTTSPAIAFDAAVAMAETMTSTTLPPAPAPAPTSPVGRRLPPPSSRMGRQLNSTNSLYVEQCLGTPDHVSLIHMLAHRIHASCR